MKYILTAGWDDGVADLTERIVKELAAGKNVLWLVSGGSNIPASVQIMNNIEPSLSSNLSVTLADERYGEPGHPDSNWTQLLEAGFDTKRATALPVLQAEASFEQSIEGYAQIIEGALRDNDVAIAQLGIGPDGHVAGILPGSPAAIETKAPVCGYQGPHFKRLTVTFPALRRLTTAYAFAFGKPKHQALLKLQSGKAEPSRLPAQVLNELDEAYLYSDQVGNHV